MAKKQNTVATMAESGAFSRRADSFKTGQRVRMTAYAAKHLRPGKKSGVTGKVVGIESTFGVKVLQDGYKQPRGFAAWFWEPMTRKGRTR